MPGGLENSQTLAASKVVGEILKKHESEGKVVAAICAGNVNIWLTDTNRSKK